MDSLSIAYCIVAAYVFLVFWYVFASGRMRLTLWHFAAFGAAGVCVAYALDAKTELVEWIDLAINGANIGAMVFFAGLIAMFCVMLYNLIVTGGRTMVR